MRRSVKSDYSNAIADFNEAIRLEPTAAVCYFRRAEVLERQGKFEQAVADYNEAIRLNPSFLLALKNLASILATCPEENLRDGKRALQFAKAANDLDKGDTAGSSAAYAELKNFDEAVKWQTKVVEFVKDEKHKRDARQRLQLYQSGQPYRAPRLLRRPNDC